MIFRSVIGFLFWIVVPAVLLANEPKWYRGNTHTHTILCAHADSTPEAVTQWYLDHGYHFLCLSEHNIFIDPAQVKLPENRRKDFILIPGEEVSSSIHTTALNISSLQVPTLVALSTNTPPSKIIQNQIDGTRALSGVPIINHPNFQWAFKATDMRPVKNCYLFELYNAHPATNNSGDETRPSTEKIWDTLLTDGMVIYGVAADDAHKFIPDSYVKPSLPGRGWVMVQSPELTSKAIVSAMERGDFYASSGIFLKEVLISDKEYKVVVDKAASEEEIAKAITPGQALKPADGASRPECKIEFIGPEGKILLSVNAYEASYPNDPKIPYVRAKVSLVKKQNADFAEYYAWTQPKFNDRRVQKLESKEPK
jgi:hypothetical protein